MERRPSRSAAVREGMDIAVFRTYFICMIHWVAVAAVCMFCASLSSYGQESDSRHPSSAWHASVDENGGGTYFVVWTERTNDASRIRGMSLATGQNSGFTHYTVSEALPGDQDTRPAVAWLNRDKAVVAWERSGGGSRRLLYRVIDIGTGKLGTPMLLSDAPDDAMYPVLRRLHGGVVAAWQDFRNRNLDIYCRRLNAAGLTDESAFRVNDDAAAALQGRPFASVSNRDRVLLLWADNRVDGLWKFYIQQYGNTLIGDNVLLDSAQRKAMTSQVAAAWMSADTAVFVWKDYREGHSNIYRRIGDMRSMVFSKAQRVNDDSGASWQRLPELASVGAGRLVACWEDYRNTENNQLGDVYMQVFARDGSMPGNNVRVNDRDDRINRNTPLIAASEDGSYLVLWHQGEDGRFHLFGQWFRYPVERLGPNFCLTCEGM
jgi:hypothetical protein